MIRLPTLGRQRCRSLLRLHNFEYDGKVLPGRGNSDSDADTNSDGNGNGYCDGDSDSNCDSNTIGDSPYANAARSSNTRSSPVEPVVASLPATPKAPRRRVRSARLGRLKGDGDASRRDAATMYISCDAMRLPGALMRRGIQTVPFDRRSESKESRR